MINKTVFLVAIDKFKKAIKRIAILILITAILVGCTLGFSYYLAIISLPLLAITIYVARTVVKQIINSYKYLITKEKYWPDGTYYENSKIYEEMKQSFTLVNGKRHGATHIFYEDGKLMSESQYNKGYQEGLTISYDRNGNIIRKSNYRPGRYFLCDGEEYFENGNIRMIQGNSIYSFFDAASKLKCSIKIASEVISMDDYKNNMENCWYKWHWNRNVRVLYTPLETWQEFNDNGSLHKELIFTYSNINNISSMVVNQIIYNDDASIQSTKEVIPQKINIERFASSFSFERLIEKKAVYRKMHMNPGGWVYERFDIPVVKGLEDVLEVGEGIALI